MARESGGEMQSVKKYFDTEGFERWRRIYSDTTDVSSVQLDIREGHAQTVAKTLAWLPSVEGVSIADCGCGTGALTTPLALRGAVVSASDISSSMCDEAERRTVAAMKEADDSKLTAPSFETADLESVSGDYHTVCCLDVLIHYADNDAAAMIGHLASLASDRLLLSFAPKTPYYSALKRVGELFPGPSKATRAYLHREVDVQTALERAGWKVSRREMTGTKFYFSTLYDCVRA